MNGLTDADVRFDAADEDFPDAAVAPVGENFAALGAAKGDLGGNRPQPLGQLRRRRAEALRILLGGGDGHAEDLCPVDQPADVPDEPRVPGMSGSSLACTSTTSSAASSRFISSGLRRREVASAMLVRIAGKCGVRNAECASYISATRHLSSSFESGVASMSVFLGIDIGTSGTKTLAIDERGRFWRRRRRSIRAITRSRCGASRIRKIGGRRRWRRFRRSSRKRSSRPADVKAIGLSGQMHGSVFLDKSGKVIRRALLWNDQRTQDGVRGDR